MIGTISGFLYEPWAPLLLVISAASRVGTGNIVGVSQAICLGGAPYVQAALADVLGGIGFVFVAAAMSLFAFTTLVGNYYYCEGCLRYIINRKPSKTFMTAFRLLAVFIVFPGAILSMDLVWNMADLTQALMVIFNIPAILLLAKPAILALKDYERQKKAGKDLVFHAEDIGLKGKTEFWQ